MSNRVFSQGPDGEIGRSKAAIFIIGRVKSVVLGEFTTDGVRDPDYKYPRDIGKIRYEMMYTNMNMSKAREMTEPAYPIFMGMKQYPLVSEIVYIIPGPDPDLNEDVNNRSYFYFPPFSVWNSPQHGAFPNLNEWADYIYDGQVEGINASVSDKSRFPALPVGKTFEEKRDVRKLQPFEGDTIIESRFGQSIRFGSTVVSNATRNNWSLSGGNGNPILIIRNGQGLQKTKDYFVPLVEDVNEDPSSIWMTSDQTVSIKGLSGQKKEFPLASYYGSEKPEAFTKPLERLAVNTNTISAAEMDSNVILPGSNDYNYFTDQFNQ